MTKLTKAQEKRFDEKYDKFVFGQATHASVKQHLADELAKQRKEWFDDPKNQIIEYGDCEKRLAKQKKETIEKLFGKLKEGKEYKCWLKDGELFIADLSKLTIKEMK